LADRPCSYEEINHDPFNAAVKTGFVAWDLPPSSLQTILSTHKQSHNALLKKAKKGILTQTKASST
jgi:hypothetical protein